MDTNSPAFTTLQWIHSPTFTTDCCRDATCQTNHSFLITTSVSGPVHRTICAHSWAISSMYCLHATGKQYSEFWGGQSIEQLTVIAGHLFCFLGDSKHVCDRQGPNGQDRRLTLANWRECLKPTDRDALFVYDVHLSEAMTLERTKYSLHAFPKSLLTALFLNLAKQCLRLRLPSWKGRQSEMTLRAASSRLDRRLCQQR